MYAAVILLTTSLLLLTHAASLFAQDEQRFLQFRNMSIGMGFNSSDFTITYPEARFINHSDPKHTLLIDLRVNFLTAGDYQFSSIFQFWSWADNSGARNDIPQNGMNDFAFLFDIMRFFPLTDRIEFIGGIGGGIHLMSFWTNFPLDYPYYETGTLNQLQQIYEQRTIYSPGVLSGIQFEIREGLFLTSEARYEFASDLKQWKFLMGISLF